MKKLLTYTLIIVFCMTTGCGFARIDMWTQDFYASATVFTFGKEIDLGPYHSVNNSMSLYTPWFLGSGVQVGGGK